MRRHRPTARGVLLLILLLGLAGPASAAAPTATPLGGGAGRILFSVLRNDSVEIVTVDLQGNEHLVYSDNDYLNPGGVYSPDGKYIVFSANHKDPRAGGVGNLYITNADGSNLDRLTEGPGNSPSWSPDGSAPRHA